MMGSEMVHGGVQGASGCGVLVSCDRADGYLGGPFWRYERVDK